MIIKVCGFTRSRDVEKACELGVDMIGVILVEGSKRQVDVDQARNLLSSATAKKVVVCKPSSVENLLLLERTLEPDYFQLHPSLSVQELQRARESLDAGLILVVPVPPAGAEAEQLVEQAKELEPLADYLLIDTKGPHGGGTGITHDWSVSRRIVERCDTPVLLAGGLNPFNVEQAIRTVRPAGVDVASGVEQAPGIKDEELMREFVEKARKVSA